MAEIKFPFGEAAQVAAVGTANIEADIADNLTIIKVTGLDAARTVALTPDDDLQVGAEVVIDVVQGATGRNVTWAGTNIKAPTLVGVADDRDTIRLMWDGTDFIGGAWAKIVDAA